MNWLVKTEASTYSWDRLEKDGRTRWDGVKNPVAARHLAAVHRGDEVLVYHTGDEKAVVGVARAASDGYPDPGAPKLFAVDLEPVRRLARPVTLAEVKASGRFADFELVRVPRLSVMPVPDRIWKELLRMAGEKTT
jgi:predicted RNA-binding protein with PUA-like domain